MLRCEAPIHRGGVGGWGLPRVHGGGGRAVRREENFGGKRGLTCRNIHLGAKSGQNATWAQCVWKVCETWFSGVGSSIRGREGAFCSICLWVRCIRRFRPQHATTPEGECPPLARHVARAGLSVERPPIRPVFRAHTRSSPCSSGAPSRSGVGTSNPDRPAVVAVGVRRVRAAAAAARSRNGTCTAHQPRVWWCRWPVCRVHTA